MSRFDVIPKIALVPNISPIIEAELGDNTIPSALQVVDAAATFLEDLDIPDPIVLEDSLVVLRDPLLKGNQLGVSGVSEEAAKIEQHRGEQGFAPATIDALYPGPKGTERQLCYRVLSRIIRNYHAWNDMEENPHSEW